MWWHGLGLAFGLYAFYEDLLDMQEAGVDLLCCVYV